MQLEERIIKILKKNKQSTLTNLHNELKKGKDVNFNTLKVKLNEMQQNGTIIYIIHRMENSVGKMVVYNTIIKLIRKNKK